MLFEQENAERFMGQARQSNPDAAFNINPTGICFYVYTLKTENRVKAFAEARRLRKESKCWDTWVYYGALGGKSPASGFTSKAKPSPLVTGLEAAAGMPEDQGPRAKTGGCRGSRGEGVFHGGRAHGPDLNKMISSSQTQQQKEYYQGSRR